MSEATDPNAAAPAAAPASADIAKLVQQGIEAGIATAMKGLTADFEKKQNAGSVRDRFMSEYMKDLPEIYREKMPQTGDKNELLQAEQKVRDIFKADAGKFGIPPKNVSGSTPGQYYTPSQVQWVDDKRTPTQLVSEGLKLADDLYKAEQMQRQMNGQTDRIETGNV